MDVGIDAAGRHDVSFTRNDFRSDADLHSPGHVRHQIRIPRLPDTRDAPILDPDVRLNDPRVIDDKGIGDDECRVLRWRWSLVAIAPCRLE